MSSFDSNAHALASSCIWRQNEALIRRLYLEDNHTLAELKRTLETQHAFPTTSLCTYESKIRDLLGLRKKLKKCDWIAVYQHWVQLDGKATKPRLFFHDREIPWVKAWKEIRRSGALARAPVPPDTALPNGVRFSHSGAKCSIVRSSALSPKSDTRGTTPVPMPRSDSVSRSRVTTGSTLRISEVSPTISANSTIFSPIIAVKSLAGGSHVIDFDELHSGDAWVEWKKLSLNELPFLTWADSISAQYLRTRTDSSMLSVPQFDVQTSISELYLRENIRHDNRFADPPETILQYAKDLNNSGALSSNFDIFYYLSKAVFLFSNVHTFNSYRDRRYEMVEQVDAQSIELHRFVMESTSRSLLNMLLDNDSLSIWAFWEAMISISATLKDASSFRTLAIAGSKHPPWIAAVRDLMLAPCARSGLLSELQILLELPEALPSRYTSRLVAQAVLAALEEDEFDCARLLLGHFGANFAFEEGESIFECMLDVTTSHRLQGPCANLCLEFGADVDRRVHIPEFTIRFKFQYELYRSCDFLHTRTLWPASILDATFFRAPQLFEHLAKYSHNIGTHMTRSGVWRASQRGVSHLTLYLARVARPTCFKISELLNLILAEQVAGLASFDCDVVLAICRYAAENQHQLSASLDLPLVYHAIREFSGTPSKSCVELLRYLVDQKTELDTLALEMATGRNSLATLEFLFGLGRDVAKLCGHSLVRAICLGDEEVVEWLVNHGVDLTSSVSDSRGRKMISLPCAVVELVNDIYHCGIEPDPESHLFSIVQRLYSRCNMWLKHAEYDPTGSRFLLAWVEMRTQKNRADVCLVSEVQFFLDAGVSITNEQHSLLLEASIGRGSSTIPRSAIVFLSSLLKQRAPDVPMAGVLALLILRGGPAELIESIIETSTDLSGRSRCGLTPLAAASIKWNLPLQRRIYQVATARMQADSLDMSSALIEAFRMNTLDDMERKRRFQSVEWLVNHGADVNATIMLMDCTFESFRPLAMAVHQNDFNLTHYLLDQGALPNSEAGSFPSDVMLRAGESYALCLDVASHNGSLDIVQLLINAGAMSGVPGGSGYDGALRAAYCGYHGAVVELLKSHIRQFQRVIPAYTHPLDQRTGRVLPKILYPTTEYVLQPAVPWEFSRFFGTELPKILFKTATRSAQPQLPVEKFA